MAKSVTAIKDILRREERLVERLADAIPLGSHRDTKDALRGFLKNKRSEVRAYKGIITRSGRCPAVRKKSR